MIKKLNIILLVAVVAMVVAKFGADALSSSGTSEPVREASSESESAALSPRILYDTIVPFAMENPMTGHNGYILDLVRAVFPDARFDGRRLDVETVWSILTNDATAVCVTYGDQERLREFPHAPTPLAETDIVLYTRRTLEWNYTGPESLMKLRVGFTDEYEDCGKLMEMYAKSLKTERPMTIFKPTDRYYRDPLAAVLDGKVDAIALTRTSFSSATIGITADTLVHFNISPPIDRIPLFLIVSGRDPEYAKRLIEAYENGRRSLEASGVLRRIGEYYRIAPQAAE